MPRSRRPGVTASPTMDEDQDERARRDSDLSTPGLDPNALDAYVPHGALAARHSSLFESALDQTLRMVEDDRLPTLFDNLSKYVPERLLKRVIASKTGAVTKPDEFPDYSREKGAVLLVDVSGFTKLSAAFAELPGGCERFLVLMNDYFNALIGDISAYGGDVMCFAGDAVVVVFRDKSLHKAALNASLCASKLVKCHSPYETSAGVTLYIHCGISIGTLNFINLGFESMAVSAATSVMLGTPMEELDVAHSQTVKGECAVTRKVWDLIKDTEHPFDEVKPLQHGCMLIGSSFSHAVSRVRTTQIRVPLDRRLDNTWMYNACHSLAPFVPPVVLENLVHGSDQWLAELRSPVIVFMTAQVANMDSASLSVQTFRKLQAVVALSIQIICDSWEGFLRQITCDEKGFVLIFAFGMPGFSHADSAARAVAATQAFAQKAGDVESSCRIGAGITTGRCYCGPIGSTDSRCEYVIAGDKVNLAARLCFKSNFGVWCEQAIADCVHAQTSLIDIVFHDRGTVKVKGKDEEIQVYEPVVNWTNNAGGGRRDVLQHLKSLPPSRQRLLEQMLHFVLTGERDGSNSNSSGSNSEDDNNGMHGKRTGHGAMNGSARAGGRPATQRALLLEAATHTGKYNCLHQLSQRLREALEDGAPVVEVRCNTRSLSFSALAPIMAQLLPCNTDKDTNPSAKQLRNDPFSFLAEATARRHHAALTSALELSSRARVDALCSVYAAVIAETVPAVVLVLHNVDLIDSASWQTVLEVRATSTCLCTLVMSCIIIDDIKPTAPAALELQSWADCPSEDDMVTTFPTIDLEDAMVLILECLNIKYVPEYLAQLVLERSERNLVYALEMCREIAAKQLVTIKHGRVLTPAPTTQLSTLLPNTMLDTIGAMIESYPFKYQIVLKIASAFGREFPEHMVAGVSAEFGLRDAMEVHGILEVLATDKLIVKHGKELWRFLHATHQEVAYGRILLAQRFDFHLSIAKKLQKVFGSVGSGPNAVVLSKHWARAVQAADTAQLFVADKDLRTAYQQLKHGAEYARDTGDVDTAVEMYSLAWLCIQKQSIVADRDPLFEAVLLSGYLKALDLLDLTALPSDENLVEKKRVTSRLFDLYEQANLELTPEYFSLVLSEAARLTQCHDHDDAAALLLEARELITEDGPEETVVLLHLDAGLLAVYLDQNSFANVMQVADHAYSLWMVVSNVFETQPRLGSCHPLCLIGPLHFMSRLQAGDFSGAKEVEEAVLTAAEAMSASDKAYLLSWQALVRLLLCGPTLQTEVMVQEFDRTVDDASLPGRMFEPIRRILYIVLRLTRHRRGQRLLVERSRYVDELLYRIQHESHTLLVLLLTARCCVESGEVHGLAEAEEMLTATPWRSQADACLWRMERRRIALRDQPNVSREIADEIFFEYVEGSAAFEEEGCVLDALQMAYSFARCVDELRLSHLREEVVVALEAVLARMGSTDAIVMDMVDKASRMLSLFRGEPCPYALPTASAREPAILRRYSDAFSHLQQLSGRHRRYVLSPEMRRRGGRLVICRKRRPSSKDAVPVSNVPGQSLQSLIEEAGEDGAEGDGEGEGEGKEGRGRGSVGIDGEGVRRVEAGEAGMESDGGGYAETVRHHPRGGAAGAKGHRDACEDVEEQHLYEDDMSAIEALNAAVSASKRQVAPSLSTSSASSSRPGRGYNNTNGTTNSPPPQPSALDPAPLRSVPREVQL